MRFYARRMGNKLYVVWDSKYNRFASTMHVWKTRKEAARAASNANRH